MAIEGFDEISLTARRGDPKIIRFQVKTDTEPEGANTSTWGKVWMTGKRRISDTDDLAVFQLTSDLGQGIVATDLVTGWYEATIPPETFRALPNRAVTLYLDIQILDPDGRPRTVSAGTMLVYGEATLAIA